VRVLEVIDNSCGFRTRIVACRKDRAVVTLDISSECEAVSRWGDQISEVEWRECLGKKPLESKLLCSAFQMLKHRSCVVPAAVIRAIEAEVGAAIPAGITVRFIGGEKISPTDRC
jgi:hypothetical protein